MKTIGMIGCGRMGHALLESFLRARVLPAGQWLVGPRTRRRTAELAARYAGLRVAGCNRDVAAESDCLFLCVRPLELQPVLEEIAPSLREGVHIISVAAGVPMRELARTAERKVTRVIPSVTVATSNSVSLVCHNPRVEPGDAEFIRGILSPVSEVMVVSEEDLPVATNLTSCGPAFVAAVCQEVVRRAVHHSGLTPADADRMVVTTLYGVAQLLYERGCGYDDVIDQVATRGGITEEGIRVLRADVPKILDRLHAATMRKTACLAPEGGADSAHNGSEDHVGGCRVQPGR